jgi:hypothetical protein
MVDNYLDIASVNGRLRSGERIKILPNLNNKVETTVLEFIKIREKTKLINPQVRHNHHPNLIPTNDVDERTRLFCKNLAKKKANYFLSGIVFLCLFLWLLFIYLTEKFTWDVIEPKFSIATVPVLTIAILFFWFLITKKELTLNPKELYEAIVERYELKYCNSCGIEIIDPFQMTHTS